jgi:hypothetical protein
MIGFLLSAAPRDPASMKGDVQSEFILFILFILSKIDL